MNTHFITTLDGHITGNFCGNINAELPSFEKHERIAIPEGVNVLVGDPLNFYTNWKRKTDAQLLAEGLIEMPEGYVLDGSYLREMTLEEKNPVKESTAEEMTENQHQHQQEIGAFRSYLRETDYVPNKIIESGMTLSDFIEANPKYAEILTKRNAARARISDSL